MKTTKRDLAMVLATVVVVAALVFLDLDPEAGSRIASAYLAAIVALSASPTRSDRVRLPSDPPLPRERSVRPVERVAFGAGLYALSDVVAMMVVSLGGM